MTVYLYVMADVDVHIVGADELRMRIKMMRESLDRLTRDAAKDVAEHLALEIKQGAPKLTGNLASAVDVEAGARNIIGVANSFKFEVSINERQAPYALYVEKGTGIFGPTRSPIKSLPGNVLVFELNGKTIFAHSVKGQRGRHFVRDAILRTKELYVPVRVEILREDLRI